MCPPLGCTKAGLPLLPGFIPREMAATVTKIAPAVSSPQRFATTARHLQFSLHQRCNTGSSPELGRHHNTFCRSGTTSSPHRKPPCSVVAKTNRACPPLPNKNHARTKAIITIIVVTIIADARLISPYRAVLHHRVNAGNHPTAPSPLDINANVWRCLPHRRPHKLKFWAHMTVRINDEPVAGSVYFADGHA